MGKDAKPGAGSVSDGVGEGDRVGNIKLTTEGKKMNSETIATLKNILDEKQIVYITEKLEEFDASARKGDKNRMSLIAKELFPYEKQSIHILNPDARNNVHCDVLICTLGMRPEPIILQTLLLKPKRLILLVTEDSKKFCQEIAKDSEIVKNKIAIRNYTISETDADCNYNEMKKILSSIEGKSKIVFDPTGGRKIMGVSAGIFAFYRRIKMVYLHARKEVNGIPEPFSERFRIIENPFEVFGDNEIDQIRKFFNEGFYYQAQELCRNVKNSIGDIKLLNELGIFFEFISIYNEWDKFMHSRIDNENTKKLSRRLEKLDKRLPEGIEVDQVHKNITFLRELEEVTREKIRETGKSTNASFFDEYRLVDIFLNGERKGRQANYDDAVARFYRCLELAATLILCKYTDIQNPEKPRYNKMLSDINCETVKEFQMKFDSLFKDENILEWNVTMPKEGVPLGLNVQMGLIYLFGKKSENIHMSKVSRAFYDNFVMKDFIKCRNRSILAHGSIPITKSDYEDFKRATEEIITLAIDDVRYRELSTSARHPKFKNV
jgi:CRISPR-associated protein (TIGR02710 family)